MPTAFWGKGKTEMKMMFVGNTSWSMWNFRSNVMLDFKSKGHDVVVVAPHDESSEFLREKFIFEPIYSLSRKGKNPFRDVFFIYELFKIYKRHNPDHIFQYTIKPNIYGSIAALFCGKKPYSIVAGMGYVFTNLSVLTVVVSIMYRIATNLSRRILFLNQEDIIDFKRLHMLPKNSRKALLLPGEGVDTEHFSLRLEYGEQGMLLLTNNQKNTFVFVGRLLIDKGIREFLKTARIIKKKYTNISFNVVGPIDSGNPMAISEDELRSYIADKSINYCGSVSDVRPYIKEADALILPTYYGEGLSRACLESLSMGVPVIATDNRGCTPIVIHKITGLIVPRSNLAALPSAVEEFIHLTAEQRLQMGRNGHNLVKNNFSVEKVIEFYDKLVSGNTLVPNSSHLIQVTQPQSSKP